MLKFKGEQDRFHLWWSEIASWGKVGFGWRSGGGTTTGENTERVELLFLKKKEEGNIPERRNRPVYLDLTVCVPL